MGACLATAIPIAEEEIREIVLPIVMAEVQDKLIPLLLAEIKKGQESQKDAVVPSVDK